MLGKSSKPKFKAKAAESIGLLAFPVDRLQHYLPKLRELHPGSDKVFEAECLIESGKAALYFEAALRSSPAMPSIAQNHEILLHFLQHVMMFQRAGGHTLPKHHLVVHGLLRISFQGNPRGYTTYHDEHLNGIIARIAHSSHRATFAETVFRKFALLSQAGSVCGAVVH